MLNQVISLTKASIFVLVVSSCGAPNPTASLDLITQQSTTSLWIEYSRTNSAPILSLIETELVARGETRFGSSFIGQRSVSALGSTIYSRQPGEPTSSANVRNCSDFNSSAEAQRYFIVNGGPARDPSDLDRDGDGLACEWGTQLRRSSERAQREIRQSQQAAARRSAALRRCYTGPRGGTYTITASGARDYNGC